MKIYIYVSMHLKQKNYIWYKCDPVEGMEGEEASLCLKSEGDCAVFAS